MSERVSDESLDQIIRRAEWPFGTRVGYDLCIDLRDARREIDELRAIVERLLKEGR